MSEGSAASEMRQWDGRNVSELLNLHRADDSSYRSYFSDDNKNGRIFGGQLIGQALMAAQQTVEPSRLPSSMQILFTQGALTNFPIDFQVFSLQEGKRFSSRRVEGRQGERFLITATATFQRPASGLEHAMPPYTAVEGPDSWLSMSSLAAASRGEMADFDWGWFEKPCLELRVVDPQHHLISSSPTPHSSHWIRLRERICDDPQLHAAALAYLSDYWINTAAITYHVPTREVIPQLYIASLNHSIWFHRNFRADEWLLFSTESPSTHSGRALTMGRIYNRQGSLIASVAQECLLVPRVTSPE